MPILNIKAITNSDSDLKNSSQQYMADEVKASKNMDAQSLISMAQTEEPKDSLATFKQILKNKFQELKAEKQELEKLKIELEEKQEKIEKAIQETTASAEKTCSIIEQLEELNKKVTAAKILTKEIFSEQTNNLKLHKQDKNEEEKFSIVVDEVRSEDNVKEDGDEEEDEDEEEENYSLEDLQKISKEF